jgi:WD40 repeat protein
MRVCAGVSRMFCVRMGLAEEWVLWQICTLRHSNIVRSVAFSTDGKRVVCGCGDKLVTIWNAATGALVSSVLKG